MRHEKLLMPVKTIKLLCMIADSLAREITQRITRGDLRPGQRLPETRLARQLDCSRNSLREAFRFLANDGLVTHIPNRGVFVRTLTAEAISEIYTYRRIVECAAVAESDLDSIDLSHLDTIITEARRAAEHDDWHVVGSLNAQVHLEFVALAGVDRLVEDIRPVIAQARIAFLSLAQRDIHEPFISQNAEIIDLLRQKRRDDAVVALRKLLDIAQQHVLDRLDS